MGSNRADYMSEYRKTNSAYHERDRTLNRIRNKAAKNVAQNHIEEYRAEILRLCKEEGIEPPR